MKKPDRFWMILGPDREVLAFVNVNACGYETPADALANLKLSDCFARGIPVSLAVQEEASR